MSGHLASEVFSEEDVASGEVSVDKVLAGEVAHAVGHLPAEQEQLCREGRGDGEVGVGGGRGRVTRAEPPR